MSSKAEEEHNAKTDGAVNGGKDKDEEKNYNNNNDYHSDDDSPELDPGRQLDRGPTTEIVDEHATIPNSQIKEPGAYVVTAVEGDSFDIERRPTIPGCKGQDIENNAAAVSAETFDNDSDEASVYESDSEQDATQDIGEEGGGDEGGPTTVPGVLFEPSLVVQTEQARQRQEQSTLPTKSDWRYAFLTVGCAVVVVTIVVGILIVLPSSLPSSLPPYDNAGSINTTKPVEEPDGWPQSWVEAYSLCLPQSYSRERERLLQNLLNQLSVFATTEEATNLEVDEMSQQDICSPQYLALTAMMIMMNDKSQNATAITAPITAERYNLAVLFFATAGPTWKNQTNWLSDEYSLCEWHGVTCGNNGTEVIQLDFDQNGLKGSIPDELFGLTSLRSLDFNEEKDLSAAIPPTIVHLTNLVSFRYKNSATGGIPSELGFMTKLTHVHIGGPRMAGVIPSSLGGLTELETLNLQSSGFGGVVPSEIANLSNLRHLVLSGKYTGHFPDEIIERLSLRELALYSQFGADIQGHFFDAMFEPNPDSWRFIIMHNNRWNGTIPNSIGKATRLKDLELSKVPISGTIPTELGLCTRLRQLQLADLGDLRGTLPSELGALTRLTNLRVTDPAVNGTIPTTFLQLTNLIHLQLGSGITGSIPAGICGNGLQQLVVSDQSSLCDSCRLMECCSC